MNFKRISTALTIGFLVSALCTWMLGRKLTANASRRAPELHYIAPAHAMASGEKIRAEDLVSLDWPSDAAVAGAFDRPETLVGRTLLYPVEHGQPITERFLSAPGAGAGLASRIPDGMRAIALRSDEIVGVAGFLLPDSHVDVLATVHTDKNPEPTTFIVLQNAQVLAAGHQVQPDPEGKPATVTVVTLLLSPADAERAVLASLQGTIHFILRSGSDKVKSDDSPVDLAQLVAGHSLPVAAAEPVLRQAAPRVHKAATPPPQLLVETFAGDKVSSETFKAGK